MGADIIIAGRVADASPVCVDFSFICRRQIRYCVRLKRCLTWSFREVRAAGYGRVAMRLDFTTHHCRWQRLVNHFDLESVTDDK
jgi:hypothetical protein